MVTLFNSVVYDAITHSLIVSLVGIYCLWLVSCFVTGFVFVCFVLFGVYCGFYCLVVC